LSLSLNTRQIPGPCADAADVADAAITQTGKEESLLQSFFVWKLSEKKL